MRLKCIFTCLSLCLSLPVFGQENRRIEPIRNPKGVGQAIVSPLDTPASLDELVGSADLIVDGTVTEAQKSRLRNPKFPTSLETDYVISVGKTLGGRKKSVAPNKVMVSQIGGKIGDLEVVTPQIPRLEIDRRYILFLTSDDRPSSASSPIQPRFIITGVWVGQFKIQNEKIYAADQPGPSFKAYDGEPVEQFLGTVERLEDLKGR